MRAALIIIAVSLIAGFCWWHFLYTPNVLKRHTEQALQAFAQTVESKDRAKIGAALQLLLADTARIHLEVTFFSLTQQDSPPAVKQDFTRQEFISFVDNILYTLTDYSYRPMLESLTPAPDKQTASVMFSSKEWADGASLYAGTAVQMRFSSETACGAELHFADKQPVIDKLSCAMGLKSIPKPGEAQKIQQNPEMLKQLLR